LWGFGLHVVWLFAGHFLFAESFELSTLLALLSSSPAEQAAAIKRVHAHQNSVARYFLTLYFASLAIPALIRHAITSLRLDRHDKSFSSLFRFHEAPWYYLLTGADFKNPRDVDYIQISAVVDVAGEPVLFTGVLDDFFFTADGQLDRLVLEAVARRPFKQDKGEEAPSPERFYSVDGDYFVIRYSEAITLNVEYVMLQPISGSPTGGSEPSTVPT
jgi:hypothetical protein